MTDRSFLARGYIASGEFKGHRSPQHLQNQIVKTYCDSNNLEFVLSRAEYWINGSTKCQLWAALKEGFKHIVFFSLWQLPDSTEERDKVYFYCMQNSITLHFATEKIRIDTATNTFEDIEILIRSNLTTREMVDFECHFATIRKLLC